MRTSFALFPYSEPHWNDQPWQQYKLKRILTFSVVTTAHSLSSQHTAVIIIGADIDLLMILTALSPPNIYFQKVGKDKSPNALYSNELFKYIEIV